MSAKPISLEQHTEVKKCFKTLRDKCLYIVGRSVGYRVSELLSIKVKDVYQKDYVKVARDNVKGKTQSRECILNKEAREVIAEYLSTWEVLDLEAPLFISRKFRDVGHGQSISRFQAHRVLKAAFNEAGLQGSYSTHSMRKSFSLNVFKKSGNDLFLTMQALGHADINTTIKYLPKDVEQLDKIGSEDF